MTLYGLTAFSGAFLAFQLQPMIAKFLLPWFGGGPAIWTACMLFFQVGLLTGYAYAHVATRYLGSRTQAAVHVALLFLALATLPIAPAGTWKHPMGDAPTLRILVLLTASIGLPYVLLASTTPLVQAWHARSHADPYPLYAHSNTGSFLGLLAYPLLVEPLLSRGAQTDLWGLGFVLFVGLSGLCVLRASHLPPLTAAPTVDDGLATPSLTGRVLWLALPACASLLLLAVTNQLCENTASFPLLWLLPLSVYLLSFILSFADVGLYRRRLFGGLLVLALANACWLLSAASPSLLLDAITYVLVLFVCCMVCHGELAALKPHPRYMTAYYLTIALGGALGGMFVTLVAPVVFDGYFELHAGLIVCPILLLAVFLSDPSTRRQFPRARRAMIACAVVAIVGLAGFLGRLADQSRSNAVELSRSFYGVLTVADIKPETRWHSLVLRHGDTFHGLQFTAASLRREPTSYYGRTSGVGLALAALSDRPTRRIGVVGLGVGTLTAYARASDYLRFYELDPGVVAIAKRRFTYLDDSPAPVDVIVGDARLSMEREPSQHFDLLVLDAFSSDAIPVHLLTEEAFDLYWRHLAADGIIAVHVSNRYLELAPVLGAIAARAGAESVDIWDPDDAVGRVTSRWVLVAKAGAVLDLPAIRERAAKMNVQSVQPWTDDYANILAVLKIDPFRGGHLIFIDPPDDGDGAQARGDALTARE